jgi:phosphoesterase family protein
MGFYTQGDLPFYYDPAEKFAIDDRYFASVMGPTLPNRLYQMAATSNVPILPIHLQASSRGRARIAARARPRRSRSVLPSPKSQPPGTPTVAQVSIRLASVSHF